MRDVPVSGVGAVAPELVAAVANEVGRLLTLADVLAWARDVVPARQVEEIVTQDEYTHDILLPYDGAHFLAFDAT